MKPVKGVDGQQVVDSFQHDLLHSEELLEIYPDLHIATQSNENAIHEIEYFSTSISSEVDACDFSKENPATYIYTHIVHPYKIVQLNCPKCDGKVRVNSNPHKIPIFLEHETVFRKEFTINCFVYEDLFKSHNMSNKVLSETQLYIISKLNEHTKNNNKLDLFGLSNSLKILLPFS